MSQFGDQLITASGHQLYANSIQALSKLLEFNSILARQGAIVQDSEFFNCLCKMNNLCVPYPGYPTGFPSTGRTAGESVNRICSTDSDRRLLCLESVLHYKPFIG